eukprot:XP_011522443.1 uncharacterized protein LOC100130370 isoform X2 [Homo sapiens]
MDLGPSRPVPAGHTGKVTHLPSPPCPGHCGKTLSNRGVKGQDGAGAAPKHGENQRPQEWQTLDMLLEMGGQNDQRSGSLHLRGSRVTSFKVWPGTPPIQPYAAQDWLNSSTLHCCSPMTRHFPPATAGSPVTPQAAQMPGRSCWCVLAGVSKEPEPAGDTPISVSGEKDR